MELPARKRNRLSRYDYSQPGCYFVTICTQGRRHLFWEDVVGAACGRPSLNAMGQLIERKIGVLSHTYPMVRVDKHVVMPNHIHMMIRICAVENGRPEAAPTLSRIVNQFKGSATKCAGRVLWQKGYHDHIVRNEADYLRIWQYIDTNPAKWREDCYYTEVEC